MKEYIKPTINIQQVVVEQLLAASNSEGGNIESGYSKRNDFWADEDEASTSEDWN